MRNWSFQLTPTQVRSRSKTVTRRSKGVPAVGELRQPVVQQQGLQRGAHVEPIGGPVRVVSVRWEPLNAITVEDCVKEGFPEFTPEQFVAFYRRRTGGPADQPVARIEFEYVVCKVERLS